jgi:hypothetical protein
VVTQFAKQAAIDEVLVDQNIPQPTIRASASIFVPVPAQPRDCFTDDRQLWATA